MANKAKPKQQASSSKSHDQRPAAEPKQSFTVIPFQNFWIQAVVLVAIGFALYCNTFDGEYALDDGIVIEQNQFVQCGFDSIGAILSKDAYDSFYKQMGSTQQLSGGRYRPLSIVTFAIEQGIFTDSTAQNGYKIPTRAQIDSMPKGTSFNLHLANIRHVVNVILYIISIVVLFYFLRTFVFKSKPDLAFFTALLFLAHPIHTEVVANVKSRDEILSFLFIICTFIFVFRYVEKKKYADLAIGMAFYFLAFLSKEYAVVLIALVPVSIYVLYRKSITQCAIFTLPLVAVFMFYFVVRVNSLANSNGTRNLSFGKRLAETNKHIENPEVLNNPYVFATPMQKWATKISTVSNYLKLLAFPHPLSSDYSFDQIPYKNFGHWSVWLSLFLHFSLIYYGWVYIRKRHILGFAIFVYLVYLSMVGNILMDIGATMGERLIYHSSLGFCIALVYFIFEFANKLKGSVVIKQIAVLATFTVIVMLYGFKTVERNEDWKSDITLFTKDVETVPNSVLANGNAGARCIDLADFPENKDKREEYLNKAIQYLNKALKLHPKYVNGYLNLGLANYKMKNLEQSKAAWDMARKYFPNNPYLRQFCPLLAQEFLARGFKKAEQKDLAGALFDVEMATQLDPGNFMMFYHLGGAYYTVGNYNKAYESWQRCLQLNPNYEEAKKGITALQPLVKK